jgi:hypothetical protein
MRVLHAILANPVLLAYVFETEISNETMGFQMSSLLDVIIKDLRMLTWLVLFVK